MFSSISIFRSVHRPIAIFTISLLILGALALLFTVKLIVLAVLLGIGLGNLVLPFSESMQRRFKIPRAITSLLFLLIFYGAFLSVGYLLGSMISDEIVPLMRKLPQLVQSAQAHFPILGRLGHGVDLEKYFGGAAEALVSGLKFGASFLGGLVFIFFVALYFAIQPDTYVDGFVSAFPLHMRVKVRTVLAECGRSLRSWFFAQLLAMAIVALVAAVGLKIVSSPYWLFFAGIVFVLELIPYFGPITAFATVCAVTAAADPDALLKTAGAFGAVLFLEGHVIVPLVMRGRAHLPPVHLLFLLTVMGEWFGVVGFLMAAPTLMIARTIYRWTYLQSMDSLQGPAREVQHLREA